MRLAHPEDDLRSVAVVTRLDATVSRLERAVEQLRRALVADDEDEETDE